MAEVKPLEECVNFYFIYLLKSAKYETQRNDANVRCCVNSQIYLQVFIGEYLAASHRQQCKLADVEEDETS